MFDFTSPAQIVARCQQIMAHAWVVRAFVRHSDEAEDFPEVQEIDRAIFDFSRALETRVDDPAGYLKMLAKKLGKFRAAVEKFAADAPRISSHTNYAQSVISLRTCVDDLAMLRDVGLKLSLTGNTQSESEHDA